MAGIASVSLTPLRTASCSDVIGGGIVTDARASYLADATQVTIARVLEAHLRPEPRPENSFYTLHTNVG